MSGIVEVGQTSDSEKREKKNNRGDEEAMRMSDKEDKISTKSERTNTMVTHGGWGGQPLNK